MKEWKLISLSMEDSQKVKINLWEWHHWFLSFFLIKVMQMLTQLFVCLSIYIYLEM